MIVDGILLILNNVLNILLSPISIISIGVDFVASIPIFARFIQVIAYLIPWWNILPLIILTISIISLKIIISLVKTIWSLIPFV